MEMVRPLVSDSEVVGRERELALLEAFLDAIPDGPIALVLRGDAGIGKTTLLKAALARAHVRSYRVVVCRPAESEAKLSFAALGDLFEGVPGDLSGSLPEPQARALDVALLRAEPEQAELDRRAVSVAVHGVLHGLAGDGPLVVAVDDAQWLDPPTAGVLEFALRRLEADPVGVLMALRADEGAALPLGLERLLPEDRLQVLSVSSLAVETLGLMLRDRLGEVFPRPTLVRLHQMSGGNPFFALEIARATLRGERPATGQSLPVPRNLREVVRRRLAALPPVAREALLVTSALSNATVEVVRAALQGTDGAIDAVETAVEAAVIEVEGGRISFTHPLFGSVTYSEASAERRQRLHQQLARVAVDVEERARHLALAVTGPDPDVAAALDEAARAARARGAPDAAAELSEMALQVSPPDRPQEVWQRTMRTALHHVAAGNSSRALSLLEEAVATAAPGPDRAEALRRLGALAAETQSWIEGAALLHRALDEAGDDAVLRVTIEQILGYAGLFTGDLPSAESHARSAIELAEAVADPAKTAEALQFLSYLGFVRGRGVRDDLLDRAIELEEGTEEFWDRNVRPTFVRAQLLKYTGRLDDARIAFTTLLERASERGQENLVPPLRYHLAELECWAGNWQTALDHAERGVDAAVQTGLAFYRANGLYARALVEAHLGRVESARASAREGLELSEARSFAISTIQNRSVLGFLELSLGHHAEAHRQLEPAADLLTAIGVEEPGVFRLVPDEVEALVALGDPTRAESVLGPFEASAKRLDRGWAMAAAARCRGLLLAASGDTDASLAALREAVAQHERVPEPFERARTILVLGQVRRRAKLRRDAREALEEAVDVFDRLGAALWAARARAEVGRIGGRAPSGWDLTPSEQRVAELVAAGQTNREVADALFLTVNTVESNLKRVYRKLGIRSRSALAARMGPAKERDEERASGSHER